MPKFKATIREQPGQKNKDGEYNIKIRITHQGKTRYIGTDYYVAPDQIDDGAIVDHPSAPYYNIQIRNTLNLYDMKIMDLGNQVKQMDIRTLMNHLRGIDSEGRDGDFYFLSESVVQGLYKAGRTAYANSVEYTIDQMKAFSGPRLQLTAITPEYLSKLEMELKTAGKSINSAGILFRNVRMIYNKGIDAGKVSLEAYPFRRFKIKKAASRDKDLDLSDIRKLKDLDLNLVAQARARDLFMLSFYMCGMNFKDLLYAQKADIRKGRINKSRIKTNQPLSILITPEAQAIIDKYPGDKFLLGIIEKKLLTAKKDRTSILHTDIISQTNIKLKKIAKDHNIPGLTSTYNARHSWSSIAFNECGASEEIIGLALGHASPRRITAGYIKKKYDQVDKVNEEVIEILKE